MKTLSLPVFWIMFFLFSISTSCFSQNSYFEWEGNYNKGIDALNNKNYKEANLFLQKAYNVAKDTFKENNANFSNSTYYLGYTYQKISDFRNALKYYLESLAIIESNQSNNNEAYIDLTSRISIVYKKTGAYKKALTYNELSSSAIEKLHGEKSTKYGKSLSDLSQIYADLGQNDKAIQIQKNVLSLYSDKDKTDIKYVLAIFTMSVLYHNIKEYQKEIQLLEVVKDILSENHFGYISANNNIGQAYQEMGHYENALKHLSEVAKNTRKDDQNHPIRLQNLAYTYTYLGEFKKASQIYDRALISCKDKYGTNHYLYAKLVDCIGQMHAAKGDYKLAEETFKKSLDIFLKNFNENHAEYDHYLNNYADALLNSNQYDEAIALMIKNIKILEANSRTDTEDYFRRQLALANAYNKIGNYTEALNIAEAYIEKLKLRLGNEHPDYGNMLKTLSESYLGMGKTKDAIPYIDSSNEVLISQIDKVFKFRSEKEKQTFLKTVNINFDAKQSISFHLKKPNDELNAINLNNQIMLKGLLLNDSKNLFTQLASLENAEIDNKIITYRSLKTYYSKSLSIPFEELKIDIDSLKNVINEKEVELVKLNNSYFKNDNILSSSWKASQVKLGKDDIAIEFSHFNLTTKENATDSIMYVTYIYKSGWEFPIMTPLFEEQELKNIIDDKSPNLLYNSNELYKLIWKPLEAHLKSSKNIYYSPSGLLNQISFAAIKNDESSTLSNHYNLFQLSNTGVLANGLTEPKTDNTLFIGGITYDYTTTLNTHIDSSYAYLNSESIKNVRGTKTRGESWDYLKGSMEEIKNLQELFNSNNKTNYILSAENASESAFKKLNGRSPKVLHIATHGYFYENIKSKPINNFNMSTEDKYRLADDPLLRSGLLLAGANYTWKNGYNPYEEEDGILTALEISNLDLSNTDIVILSACETGLGDINGSEGVYGLQRAFKMAGVDIIVMSLWKVPDFETAGFMKQFYNNWLVTNNVKKSFNQAQRTMQTKYSADPEIWAAFVLFE